MIVVDDLILLGVLSQKPGPAVQQYVEAAERRELYTTGYWFWRLGRALAQPHWGALHRWLVTLTEAQQQRVYTALETLPAGIGMLSPRHLMPVMAALPGQLTLPVAEAVASAIVLDAPIATTSWSGALLDCAEELGVEVDVVQIGF